MRSERKKTKDKNDLFVRLTYMQIGFCILLFAVVFGSMKLNPDFFDSLRGDFLSLIETDYGTGSVNFFDIGSQWEKRAEKEEAEENAKDGEADPGAEEETSLSEAPEEESTAEMTARNEETAAVVSVLKTNAPRPVFAAHNAAVMPVSGWVTSGYGERIHPVYGNESFHSGIDIGANEGTPVHAALDGTVTETGLGQLSGNYIKIDHGDGKETLYCHLSAFNVGQGVKVRKGDVIGFVGQTGLATGPHLHFEVRISGEKVDPNMLLEDAVFVSAAW